MKKSIIPLLLIVLVMGSIMPYQDSKTNYGNGTQNANMDQGKKLGLKKCGNGIYNPDLEQCDDGNSESGDGCFSCSIQAGWECPSTDSTGKSICNPIPVCGNGKLEAGEQCDWKLPGRSCTSLCTIDSSKQFTCAIGQDLGYILDQGQVCENFAGCNNCLYVLPHFICRPLDSNNPSIFCYLQCSVGSTPTQVNGIFYLLPLYIQRLLPMIRNFGQNPTIDEYNSFMSLNNFQYFQPLPNQVNSMLFPLQHLEFQSYLYTLTKALTVDQNGIKTLTIKYKKDGGYYQRFIAVYGDKLKYFMRCFQIQFVLIA